VRFAAALSAILGSGAMLATVAVAQPLPMSTPTHGPRLILLGTGGGPLLRTARAQSASAIVLPEGLLLVDAGEGSIERMTEAGLGPDRIKTILITHLHIDHVAALWSLLLHRWAMRAQGQLEVVGPPGTRAMVDALARASGPIVEASRALGADAPAIASMVTVTECGADPEQQVTLSAFPSLRIAFARNSHLDADQILDVKRPVSLAYRIDASGWSALFTGDTGPSPAVEALGRNVSLMVAEVVDVDAAMEVVERSMHLKRDDLPGLRTRMAAGHLDAQALGKMATTIAPQLLVISHISPGVSSPSDGSDKRLSAQIARSFSGRTLFAHDLMTIDLQSRRPAH